MMDKDKKNDEVTYEIKEHIGVIAKYSNKWTKELNKISWNGKNAKFDIRDWDEQHEHMSRGITLHEDEMQIMYELLGYIFADTPVETQAG